MKKQRSIDKRITHKIVKEFLKNNSTQQQFTTQKIKHNFPIYSNAYQPFQRLQIDLLDMSNERGVDRNTFCFVCVDVFTRFAMIVPIKFKNEKCCVDALRLVLKECLKFGYTPSQIDSDAERSFISKSFQNVLKIKHITS